jgi:CHAD domain-containing protein
MQKITSHNARSTNNVSELTTSSKQNALSDFEMLQARFMQALTACRAEPDAKAVHQLRTSTRRIEALLQKTVEDHPDAKDMLRSVKKTLRDFKKVRRLAGSVRDLDVHGKLVDELVNDAQSTGAAVRQIDLDAVAREHGQLNRYLKLKRKDAVKALQAGLENREPRLQRRLAKTAELIAGFTGDTPDALTSAKIWVQRSASQFGELDKDNLHDFRKETKAARYLSELQNGTPAAEAFANKLHHIQDVVGEWHDWDMLLREAKALFHKDASTLHSIRLKRDHAYRASVKAASQHRLA